MAHGHKITEKHRVLFAQSLKEGNDPISFFCDVLADERAPVEQRKEAARELKPYFHARLARMGPLIERFGK